MKLKKLTLQGFKSFKDKASIFFDHGITGIVGPNGCGKSNIVDALFWVMGEQSAKHLRGSSMKDVIFAGSSKYGPASFAEVSLTLDNTNNKYIHIGANVVAPTEIQLTRKLYRNGETEYRINGIPCRLKDIHEVFMDTGAGSKSYSVVAQGEIDRIVRSKPVDRRAMIEEVAGITKFKVRRKESVRKIEQTQENLKRIKDLKDEVYKSYKTLEQQAQKAQNAKRLQEKIRKSELLYLGHKEISLLKDWKEKSKEWEIKKLESQEFQTEKQKLDTSLELERIEKIQKQQELEKTTALYHKQSKELVAKEEKLKFILKSSKEKEKLLGQRVKENEEIEHRLKEKETKLALFEKELEDLVSSKEDSQEQEALEQRVEEIKDTLNMKEGILEELREEIQSQKDELREKEKQIFKNQTLKEDLSRQSEELLRNLEKAEAFLQDFVHTKLGLQQQQSSLKEDLIPLTEQIQGLKKEETELQEELLQVRPKAKELTKAVYQWESRLQTLQNLQEGLRNSQGGFSQYSKTCSEETKKNLGLLSDYIDCPPEYINCVQILLGKLLGTHFVTEKNLPEKALEWTLAHQDQYLDFLYLGETSQKEEVSFSPEFFPKVSSFEKILSIKPQAPESIRAYLSNLLSSCYIVEEYSSQFITENSFYPSPCAWITKDGKIYQVPHIQGIQIHMGPTSSLDPRDQLLSYQSQIQEILGQLEENKVISEELTKRELQLEEALKDLRPRLVLLEKEIFEKKSRLRTVEEALEKDAKKQLSYQQDVENFQKRHQEVIQRQNQLVLNSQGLEQEMSNQKDVLADKADYLDNLEEEYNGLKEEYDEIREEFIQQETAKRTFKVRIDSKKAQLKDLEATIEQEKKKVSYNQKLISGHEEEKKEMLEQIDQLTQETIQSAQEIEQMQQGVKEKKGQLEELLSQMSQREKRLRDIQNLLGKIEKELVRLESNLEKTVLDEQQVHLSAYEKYQLDIWESVREHLQWQLPVKIKDEGSPEMVSEFQGLKPLWELSNLPEDLTLGVFTFNRLYGQELASIDGKYKQYQKELNQLGEINWTALQDFEEYKKRYEFLLEQENQLQLSLKDLEVAITQIDEKSKKKFQQAFEEVNSRFQQVFPYLFRGGSATLELVGDFEDPECGMEIVAQPPGKKMQNILLMSGGEKAMTAVALIFSIFLVRPSPFCLLDEVDAPLDDANVGRFNDMLKEMGHSSQFILITHNKKTMELNDVLYGVTMQEPGISKAVSVQLQ